MLETSLASVYLLLHRFEHHRINGKDQHHFEREH